jgi:mRNA-degrading endonuclease RelE of RelBE toxin-antitoxin system
MFTFIESSIFEREVLHYLDDEEYAALQAFMVVNPEAGDLIPGSGGVRKLRWKRAGKGKRSGVRVIYYVRYRPNELWLLTIYAKARHDNIPAHILKALKDRFADDFQN